MLTININGKYVETEHNKYNISLWFFILNFFMVGFA